MSELTSRSFLFALTSILKSVGLLCLTFFLTPLLLKFIGPHDFGAFKVVIEVYGHLSLLDFGLYASLLACLIPALKSGKKDEVEELLSEARGHYVKATLLTLIGAGLLVPLLSHFTSWQGDAFELYLTFGLIAASSLLIPFQPYRIYLEASNQGHLVNVIMFFQNLSFMLVGITLAYLGWGMVSQGAAVLVSNLLGMVLLYQLSGIKIKGMKDKVYRHLTRMRQYQKSQVLNDLATKLCLNCDQLIIALFLGPVMVTKVFLGQRMVLIMQGQLQSMGQASFASLGALYYSNPETFRNRMLEVTKVISTMAVATLVPICVLNRPFISLWVGSGYQMESNALTYLASSNAFLYSLFSFWSILFTVLGRPKEITRMIWYQAIVNVGASIACTLLFGGTGPVAGTLISFVVVPLWIYPNLLCKNFLVSRNRLLATIFWPVLLAVLPLVLIEFSPWRIWPRTWTGLVLSAAAISSVYSLCLFFILFDRDERRMFINRLGALWKRLFQR